MFKLLIHALFFLSGNDFDDNSANYFAEAISVSAYVLYSYYSTILGPLKRPM